MKVYIFWWNMFFNSSFYIASHGTVFTCNFLCASTLESSAIYQLSAQFWQVLLLSWMLSVLVTVHKPCHVSRASRITTSGTIFTEICFGVSKEWFKSWSHVLLIKVKTMAKNFLAVRPEKVTRRKKRKKKLEQ